MHTAPCGRAYAAISNPHDGRADTNVPETTMFWGHLCLFALGGEHHHRQRVHASEGSNSTTGHSSVTSATAATS